MPASPLNVAPMTQVPRSSTLGRWIGFATALMSALAGGAVWSVLALRTGNDLTVLAFVIAAAIAWILRANGFAGTPVGTLLAALFTALACVYSQCLLAVGDVAQAMGFSLLDTLLRIGADFALAVVRGRISPWQTASYVLAMALAAWLVWRRRKTAGKSLEHG